MSKEKLLMEEKYNNELIDKEDKILILENLISDIYRSNSWKITKPLRITKKMFNYLLKRNR